ncbi:radical SAM family RiPP maturation amino acid epimerase [Microvirga puerhi]|uniref:Radical SAM family RiPP maturation amino acid epimerase n=1 Tax=Microvirga puerhi TaxID=2876078 RepID=A0ABS7VI46_9HYPH|nr:radical SAM family RiPP maturation amino acid epimerase [Microvirga puerhi]MBZ6074821.1 radical SAM family RiPP maturation amino acid epimerase [Microvirga puerhi]
MNTTEATKHYRSIFERRTPDEMRTLAHIKRFMERLVADPGFRQALADNPDDSKSVAERYGIGIDPNEMLPLYHRRYLRYRFTEEEARWPLAMAWDGYMQDMFRHRDLLREEGSMEDIHPRFHAWRERQIRRSMSELGGSGPSITHPIVAFELSEGCTVGCWFCGLSAERFRGYFPYTEENSGLWREMLETVHGMFGTAARTGFCYWATDPCDNPDYDRFIADYYHITGALPQTTTAAPLKDPDLTRRILALFDKYRTVTNRFSVLTVKHLDKIHAAFTPEELMGVELVMQNRESLTAKADAGRARERQAKLRAAGKPDKISELSRDHTTIACVSGFLVNMMKKTVQLVTPVPGSERWPLGYRVFGERQFSTGAEFQQCLEGLIDEHMVESLSGDWPARFRSDLRFEAMAGGFKLHSRSTEHTIQNTICGEAAGSLLARGDLKVADVIERLVESGVSVLVVADLLEKLFQSGLIEDSDSGEPLPGTVDVAPASLAI